ncbi:NUMOD4 domain-containing protein [Limosilactobacillus reuteri]|uniref:NUMOD4 domain-containing protein n=1 Tax=Limosilactobacillus reuteri TaxID=1598 RepID=UPI001E3C99D1|nr:NUMOD4 domain-containing protein [Limosilactobacillus reuteri]MCC4389194.1 NUMOD4 motif-containing HNH endonuclease [Limosilactobacillus reuteri]MCC4427880.1 NUMOD4 motif-containing HNH endonuclease [Limosilactobacillus reuteri]MCC4431594.1 NUMOD4 motif-containing HNH endonuclease [Limosilactobacillus reuteri]MCC4433869.1 NUMOD4 motif-containing HNH endonuclease [Limosilactobacillus reuteri]
MERWKKVPKHLGLYKISTLGRVMNSNGKILKQQTSPTGYRVLTLWNEGKPKHVFVHRLVAIAFLENPHNFPFVNHKNEIKVDNRISNLEWISAKGNSNYGSRNKRIAHRNSKPVVQLTLEGKVVRKWSSAAEAGRNGYSQAVINKCISKRAKWNKTHKGYRWMHLSDFNRETERNEKGN